MRSLEPSRTVGRLKPLARATRLGGLSEANGVVTLSQELEHTLFLHAEVLSEGGCRTLGAVGQDYFGSTMISIDLDRVAPLFRGVFDADMRRRLLRAVDGSVRVRLRAMRLARAEAMRRVHGSLGTAFVETRVRLSNSQLHIDVDLEAVLRVSSRSRLV